MLPAYAGMILLQERVGDDKKGAPRVCGDDPWDEFLLMSRLFVLPAYAGMIRDRGYRRGKEAGAPRVCGDDPSKNATLDPGSLCSPRMRG